MARFNWAQFIFMESLHPTTNRGDIHICLMDWQVKNGWLAKEGWSKLEKYIIKRSHLLNKEQMQHKTIAILKSKSNMFNDFCCHEWIESSFVQASQFNLMFRSSPF